MRRRHGSGRGGRRLAAILLVTGLVASSWGADGGSDDSGGTEPPDETRSVQLNALFFATNSDGEATGGASPVQIRVSPFEGNEFRVGFTRICTGLAPATSGGRRDGRPRRRPPSSPAGRSRAAR